MNDQKEFEKPQPSGTAGMAARGAMQAIGGAIPFAGGIISAIASAWGEREQNKANQFFAHWIQMIKDELREKEQTIIEILSRLDLKDEDISKRVESQEYQSLIRKTFREWSGAESEEKRIYIRNILANAATASLTDDDVVRMFIGWINQYSELHFKVIAAIYNTGGISRGEVWRKIGKGAVREDSAEADLYKLLFRDLSTGGIIRQHRKIDYYGNFVKAQKSSISTKGENGTLKSAFDDEEKYELTALGQQFIHYAMTDLPLKIEMKTSQPEPSSNSDTCG